MDLIIAFAAFALLAWYLWWNRSALHVNAAHAAFRKGNETKTLDHFAKAEAAGRLNAETTASYAYLLVKSGHNEQAGDLLQRALSGGRRGKPLKLTESRMMKTYQALVLRQQGKLDEAVELLEGLHAEGYKTSSLYGNLGFFLIEQGNLTRAEELCHEAAEWAPDGKVILDNLGSLHLVKGDWTQALEVYNRLLALEPKFPEAWWGAGRAALETGDAVEAKRRWQHALTLPFNALTMVERSVIEKALGELSESDSPAVTPPVL